MRVATLEKDDTRIDVEEVSRETCEVYVLSGDLAGTWYEPEEDNYDATLLWYKSLGYEVIREVS